MKSVAKQPQNLCIISVIYCFVYIPHFLKVVLIFLWYTYNILIDKCHLKEKCLGKTRLVQVC